MWGHLQKHGEVWTGLSSLIELNLFVKMRVNWVIFFDVVSDVVILDLFMHAVVYVLSWGHQTQIETDLIPNVFTFSGKGRIIFFSVTTVLRLIRVVSGWPPEGNAHCVCLWFTVRGWDVSSGSLNTVVMSLFCGFSVNRRSSSLDTRCQRCGLGGSSTPWHRS